MNLGIFVRYGYASSLKTRLQRIKAAGFESVMLWADDFLFDPIIAADLCSSAGKYELALENVHIPYEEAKQLWSLDADERNAFLEKHIRYIRRCMECGLPMIVMHVAKGYEPQHSNSYGIESMSCLVDEAEQYGVQIAIENTRKPDLVEAILHQIDRPFLGLCYDTSHGKLYEPVQFGLLKKYPHRLKCLHISDNDGIEDRHWNIGEGVIDWNEFVQCFPSGQYKGPLSLEVFPKEPHETECDHLKKAFDRVYRLRQMIDEKSC
jgi:sugar phosphate isomerase/epimerase